MTLDGGSVNVMKMANGVKSYLLFLSFLTSLLCKINQLLTCKLIVITLTT